MYNFDELQRRFAAHGEPQLVLACADCIVGTQYLNRWRLSRLFVDDRADLVPLGGQLDVVVDAGMVVAPVAVQLPQLLEIGAEGERLEGGQRPPELPEFVPAARLRRHRLSQVVGGDRLVAVEDEGSEAPLAARLERIELHRARPWGQQRDESERERRPPAPAGGSPGPPPPAHARTIA